MAVNRYLKRSFVLSAVVFAVAGFLIVEPRAASCAGSRSRQIPYDFRAQWRLRHG